MATHVALLRAVNVGGNNLVPMAALRELLADLSCAQPRTLLQSGNVVFEVAAKQTPTALEKVLEGAVRERFGASISVLVRTAAEWAALVARNPFPAAAARDPAHLVVMALKAAPAVAAAAAAAALPAAYAGPETVAVDGRHAYVVYPAGIGKSKLTNQLLEKTLGTVGTARNWNTVLKLAALLQE